MFIPEPLPGGLPDHFALDDWDPAVIEQITISPYADVDYERAGRYGAGWLSNRGAALRPRPATLPATPLMAQSK